MNEQFKCEIFHFKQFNSIVRGVLCDGVSKCFERWNGSVNWRRVYNIYIIIYVPQNALYELEASVFTSFDKMVVSVYFGHILNFDQTQQRSLTRTSVVNGICLVGPVCVAVVGRQQHDWMVTVPIYEKGRLALLLKRSHQCIPMARHEIVIAQNKHTTNLLLLLCLDDPHYIFHTLCIWVTAVLQPEQYNDRNIYIESSKYQFDIRYFLLIPFASLLFFVINHSIIDLP